MSTGQLPQTMHNNISPFESIFVESQYEWGNINGPWHLLSNLYSQIQSYSFGFAGLKVLLVQLYLSCPTQYKCIKLYMINFAT